MAKEFEVGKWYDITKYKELRSDTYIPYVAVLPDVIQCAYVDPEGWLVTDSNFVETKGWHGHFGQYVPVCGPAFLELGEVVETTDPTQPVQGDAEAHFVPDGVLAGPPAYAHANHFVPEGVNPKEIAGSLKDPLHLFPAEAERAASVVLGLGAAKYGPWNWRESNVQVMTYIGAVRRHLNAYVEGETIDPESGESHLAHIIAGVAIVLDAQKHGTLVDNRPPVPEQNNDPTPATTD